VADDARSELHSLSEKRAAAAARVAEIEREGYEAGQAATAASVALAQAERVGGSAAERRKLEAALADARSKASEPWPERLAGTRQAEHDAEQAVREYVAEHLAELVAEEQADGGAAAERINAGIVEVLAGYAEWEASAGRISSMASTVGRIHPGDVTRSRCEAVAQEARKLLDAGGEQVPRLERDPRLPRHGNAAEPEAVTAA
jgi:hypothetical protein